MASLGGPAALGAWGSPLPTARSPLRSRRPKRLPRRPQDRAGHSDSIGGSGLGPGWPRPGAVSSPAPRPAAVLGVLPDPPRTPASGSRRARGVRSE
eukprot:454140-Hanusia_phi.AAC.2